ncbi:MAG: hypothetical protein HY854_09480 [Burkholderiales bacterium]|nr:hypothetical protein [Burkholderiales bacterium]
MIYLKTAAGRAEVQARSLPLTPAQRQVLILCDGERFEEDLLEMIPEATFRPALRHLYAAGLLEARDVARPPKAEPVVLGEAERFRAMVELATSMAVDLGFAARIRAQLQIEKANNAGDLKGVVDLLVRDLAGQGKKTPLLALRLNKLRQLAAQQEAPAAA